MQPSIDPSAGPILIAEDNRNTSSLLAAYLNSEGFQTVTAYDGRQALDKARQCQPMLIVLDLMLPLVDGWEICREVRQRSDVPILILSARQEEMDRVLGLSLGADDYLVKPFSPRELVARVKAILRRTRPQTSNNQSIYSHLELTVDTDRHSVALMGKPVSLTPSEFTLLKALITAPGRVLSRQELLDHLYPGRDAVIDRVVDVHIGKLRQKIENDISQPRYILTVRGVGYRFADSDD
jgi:DNA-binding response OmpR family regulator